MSDLPPMPERREGKDRREGDAPRVRERRRSRDRRSTQKERTDSTEVIARRSPESRIAVAVASLIVFGLLVDLVGGRVEVEVGSRPAGAGGVRAVFCPAAPKGGSSSATLIAGSLGGSETVLGVEPIDSGSIDLPAATIIVRSPEGSPPLDVVGYGRPAAAAVAMGFTSPAEGAGASACSPASATRWYFAEGSSTLGFDERLLVYNPFPSQAVIRVRFYTPDGPKLKANLASVPVPARGAIGVALNDYLLRQAVVGASVETIRGRVVVWRAIFAEPDGRPHGGALTLGATEPSTRWYFPDGGIGTGFDERISILNPGREEAIVTVSLATREEVLQPPKLVELRIPPRRTKAWRLDEMVGTRTAADTGPVGVLVRSVNGQPVVAEQAMFVSSAGQQGYSSEVGLADPSTGWWVPPATTRPETDSLVVINTALEDATLSISLLREDGEPLVPAELQDVAVPSAARVRIPLSRFTEGRPMVAIVVSEARIVVQRTAYSSALGDFATVMGIPQI